MLIKSNSTVNPYRSKAAVEKTENKAAPAQSSQTESFTKSEETGFFATKPTIGGNIKKFAPPMTAAGVITGVLASLATGAPIGLGAAVGGTFGAVAGTLFGAGRPTA